MKVLIIDDTPDTVKETVDYCKSKDWKVDVIDFSDVYTHIVQMDPDVIVLDWREDVGEEPGASILETIWKMFFRPIALFTALADDIRIDDKLEQSSALRLIRKGDEQPVIDYLQEMQPYATALSEYRGHLGTAIIKSLNAIDCFKSAEGVEQQAIEYVLAKRTASYFDSLHLSNISPAWVQFLCPPIDDNLCVCDIIRKVQEEEPNKDVGDPEEYLMIVTPSCDLVSSGERRSVEKVVCVNCFSKEKFHKMGLQETPSERQIKKVSEYLNTGYFGGCISIPQLPGMLPYMTADLKQIETVLFSEIAKNKQSLTKENHYYRVASITSPFREQIVWAYMLNSCRPGVPDRNMELWAKEILTV